MVHMTSGPVLEGPGGVHDLVKTYVEAWNETNHDTRVKKLSQCWDLNGVYLDPTAQVAGRDGLAQHIADVQARRPGAYIEVVSPVDHHHRALMFYWRLVIPNRDAGRVCLDVGEVGENGLLASMTGFFCSQ